MHASDEPSSSGSDTGSGNDPSAGNHAAGMPAADEAARLFATPPRPTRPELKAASSDCRLRHRISCDSVVSLQLIFLYGEQDGGVGAAAVAAPLPALQLVFVYKYKAVPTLDAYAGLGSRDLTVRECAAWGAVVLPAGLATVTVDRFRACGSAAAQLAGLGCCYGVCSVVVGSRVDPVPSPPIPERDDTDSHSGKKFAPRTRRTPSTASRMASVASGDESYTDIPELSLAGSERHAKGSPTAISLTALDALCPKWQR